MTGAVIIMKKMIDALPQLCYSYLAMEAGLFFMPFFKGLSLSCKI